MEESIAQFVLRRLGQEFLDYAIDPLVAGIYAGNPRTAFRARRPFPNSTRWSSDTVRFFWGKSWARGERKRSGEVSKQKREEVFFR